MVGGDFELGLDKPRVLYETIRIEGSGQNDGEYHRCPRTKGRGV